MTQSMVNWVPTIFKKYIKDYYYYGGANIHDNYNGIKYDYGSKFSELAARFALGD